MLATKRSAGVAPEVNLGEHVTHNLHQVQIRLLTLVLKPRGDVTRSPKQGYQWPHKKDMFSKNFKKRKKSVNIISCCYGTPTWEGSSGRSGSSSPESHDSSRLCALCLTGTCWHFRLRLMVAALLLSLIKGTGMMAGRTESVAQNLSLNL